jgi:hypothetical protein
MTQVGLKALRELYLGGRAKKVCATTVEREARSVLKVLDLIGRAFDCNGEAGMELPVSYLWPKNELLHLDAFR